MAQGRDVLIVKEEAYAPEAISPAYWHLNSSNTFLSYSWLFDELLRTHNERFFYLTAANLKICNDMYVGMVQYRMGQHEDWQWMGMTTVIVDAMGKIKRAAVGGFGNSKGIEILNKRPSTGLDLDKEYTDTKLSSYKDYLPGHVQQDDNQKMSQLRRTTEGALQVGYVVVVNGKIVSMP